MEYQANENDILSTLHDFETMCQYIFTNKPFLTKKGDLSTKACFELNDLITYPKKGAKKTDRMGSYATVTLYFQIALTSDLLELNEEKGGKTSIALSKAYENFKQMNSFSKYLFIFFAWMSNVDIEELYAHDPYIAVIIDEIILAIGKQTEFEWILREDEYDLYNNSQESLHILMNGHFDLIHHLRNFGLLMFDDADVEAKAAYYAKVKKMRITQFGATLSAACNSRRFSWVNKLEDANLFPDDDDEDESDIIELFENDFLKNPPGSDEFFTPFIPCFPEGTVDTVTLNGLLFPRPVEMSKDTVYEFKVQLDRTCYRVIRCMGSHTFEDLHLAIQNAFDFDNDHLYSFFMDGKIWSRHRIESPYSEEPPYADEILIGQAGLREKQTIAYLFDYGDEWIFSVTLTAVINDASPSEHPVIVKTIGKSPEQYPDWDDDDWDDD